MAKVVEVEELVVVVVWRTSESHTHTHSHSLSLFLSRPAAQHQTIRSSFVRDSVGLLARAECFEGLIMPFYWCRNALCLFTPALLYCCLLFERRERTDEGQRMNCSASDSCQKG